MPEKPPMHWAPSADDIAEARRQSLEAAQEIVGNEEIEAIPPVNLFHAAVPGRMVLYTPEPEREHLHLNIPLPKTLQGERCMMIAVAALTEFVQKNAGYGEPDQDDLGSRGQFADMHRKWKLIKRHLWDGEPWNHHEPFDLVCKELIGHLLLTIDFKAGGK